MRHFDLRNLHLLSGIEHGTTTRPNLQRPKAVYLAECSALSDGAFSHVLIVGVVRVVKAVSKCLNRMISNYSYVIEKSEQHIRKRIFGRGSTSNANPHLFALRQPHELTDVKFIRNVVHEVLASNHLLPVISGVNLV